MLVYSTVIFLSAFLLFLVQPLLGKAVLPWFGGAPSVWSTCLVFFQAMLLLGYAAAHAATRLRPRHFVYLYLLIVTASLVQLPVQLSDRWKPVGTESPVALIFGLLAFTVGLPYLVLASTAPLVQQWASRDARVSSPYKLYAVSNAGSLLGLLAYPFVIERLLGLRSQGVLWSMVYGVFAALAGWLAWTGAKAGSQIAEPDPAMATQHQFLPARVRLLWFALPAAASGLLVATTSEISLNLAVVPFLWVIPLVLYLVTFMLAFGNVYPRRMVGWLVGFSLIGISIVNLFYVSAAWQIGSAGLALFALAWASHGELARRAPHTRHLTAFYLHVAGGGAIGGTLAALLAPVIFREFWEFPLFLLLSYALLLTARSIDDAGTRDGWRMRGTWAARGLLVCIVFASFGWTLLVRSGTTVVTARNFFGVLRVNDSEPSETPAVRRFRHGRIVHGLQFLDPARRMEPNAYYTSPTGIAQALQLHPKRAANLPLRIGVVGLGIGTIAAWGRTGDEIRFYEINPQVVEIAQTYFTFLRETPARTEIVPGDGRLSLERDAAAGAAGSFDVLVADAFSGDSVPVHLLTRECAELYWRVLRDDGILALNITNRFVDLAPVAQGLAEAFGKNLVEVVVAGRPELGTLTSDWMLLTGNQAFLASVRGGRTPSGARARSVLWTDTFSNLFEVLR